MMKKSDILSKVLGLRFGYNMEELKRFVTDSVRWDKEQWEEYHNKLVSDVVIHAYKHVPYYHDLFDNNGINPHSIKSENDLQNIPVTRKKDILNNPQSFMADNANTFHPMKHHTGGTTGRPMFYYNDRKSWALNWALKMYTFEQAGFHFGVDKLAVMAGGSLIPGKSSGMKHKVWRWVNNYYTMPISHLSPQVMDEYIDGLIKNKIQFLRGYPSAVSSFAEYIVYSNRFVPLKAVFTTAEMLYPHQRAIIKVAFGCDTWDTYGCGDGMGQAVDCKAHDKMHVFEQVSIMQIVNNKGYEVMPGEEGEVVLTSLYDYAMPFIRYAPGDYALKGIGACSCECTSKTINKIIGRTSDVFRFSNGRIVNGLSFPIEELTDEVKRFQIVQVERDVVEVLLEEKSTLSKERIEKLKRIVGYHCGEGVNVVVKVVDRIEVPTSEKFRYVVSRV